MTCLRRRGGRFTADSSGVAAVEFAFIAPVLILLWLGGVEVTQALSLDRRLSALAGSVGDLVSRSKMVTEAEIERIFEIVPGALYPSKAGPAEVVLTALDIDEDGKAKVAWSRSHGGRAAYAPGEDLTDLVDPSLLTPNTQLIVPEVFYSYKPAVGYVITGSLALEERMFFVPRQGDRVALCKDATETDCV